MIVATLPMTKKKPANVLAEVYYIPKGYWRSRAAISKLAKAVGVSESSSRECLAKQTILQFHLLALGYISRPKFDVVLPNEIH